MKASWGTLQGGDDDAVAEPLPVLGEEDASPAVLRAVPAAPVLERAASSPAPRPGPLLAVAEPLPPPVLAEEDASPMVLQAVPASPVLEQAASSAAPRPGPLLAVAEPLPPPVLAEEDASSVVLQAVPASLALERAASSPASRPVPSPAVAQPVSSLAMGEPGESAAVPQPVPLSPVLERAARPPDTVSERPDAGEVVLDYCTAVRGILNDDQDGPLHPCGVQMAAALGEVRQSLERSLAVEKGGPHTNHYDGSPSGPRYQAILPCLLTSMGFLLCYHCQR